MFCKYCGKEVPDGQVCSCGGGAPQQAAPQQAAPAAPVATAAPAAPAASSVVSDTLKAMPAAFKTLLGNTVGAGQTLNTSVVFGIGGLLANILTWVLVVAGLINSLVEAFSMGGLADKDDVAEMVNEAFEGVYGTAIWGGVVSFAVPVLICMAIMIVGQLIRKEKVNFVSSFIAASCLNVLPAALLLLGALLMLIVPDIAIYPIVIAMVAGIANFCNLLTAQSQKPGSALGSLITAVVLTVAVAIVASCVSGVITGYLEEMAGNLGGMLDIEDLLGSLLGGGF